MSLQHGVMKKNMLSKCHLRIYRGGEKKKPNKITTTGPHQRSAHSGWFQSQKTTLWRQSKFTAQIIWACMIDGSRHRDRFPCFTWPAGFNQLRQSSYVNVHRLPAPMFQMIPMISEPQCCLLFVLDICLDLNACLLSCFRKGRAHDGSLRRPALLTRDHGRLRLAVCSKVSVAEEDADFSWCLTEITEEHSRWVTVSDLISRGCSLHFQELFTLLLNLSCLHLSHLLSDLSEPSQNDSHNLLLSIKGACLGAQKDWKCLNPYTGCMCGWRESERHRKTKVDA